MTHTRQMMEYEGEFGMWQECSTACRRCRSGLAVYCRVWESNDGAYEDYKYRCCACGYVWWIDGIDS